jgi:PAS domain S-box-containing protein
VAEAGAVSRSPAFGELARTAAVAAGTPAAAILLLDDSKQPIVHAMHGFSATVAPMRHVCEKAMACHDLVTDVANGDARLRHCSALPIVAATGAVIGSVCVRGEEPIDMNEARRSALASVARLAAQFAETGLRDEGRGDEAPLDLFAQSLDCACVHTLDGTLTRVNPAMVAALEYDSAAELVGRSVRSLLVESVAGEFESYLHSLLEKGIAEGQMRIRTRGGTERIFHYRNAVRVDGAKVVVVAIARDVTEAVAMRRRLRDSERRYRALFENNSAGVALLSPSGGVLEVNDALAQMLGYTSREELRIAPREAVLVSPDEAAELEREVLAFGDVRGREIRMKRLDGSVIVALVGGALVQHEGGAFLQMTVVDITARKGEEQVVSDQLRQSEREYRQLFDNAHDPVLVLDEHERILNVNRAACRVYGWEKAQFIGMSTADLSVHPTPVHLARKVFASAGEFVQCQAVHRRADGSLLELDVSAGLVLYGGRRAIMSINRDVTEARRIAAERERGFTLLRTTLDTASDAICVLSAEDRVLMWNAHFARLWQFEHDELHVLPIGTLRCRVLAQVLNAEDSGALLETAIEQQRDGAAGLLFLVDGRVLERTERPLVIEGAIAGRVVSFRDVTVKRLREIEEREHREHLAQVAQEWRTIFDAMPVPMLVVDEELSVHRLNDAAVALLGWPPSSEMVQAKIDTSIEPWLTAASLVRGARTTTVEVMNGKTGQEWEISVTPFALEDAEGQHILVVRDVTLSNDLQRSLRQFESLSELGTLVVAVAHEVRNPLAGIAASIDAFEAIFTMTASQGTYISRRRREVARLNSVMAELLEYGRPCSLRMTAARIEDLLSHAAAACTAAAVARAVSLQLVEFESAVSTIVDVNRMQQVLQNVIENAIQHSAAGAEVRIRAHEEERATGIWTVVTVEDRGPGFDPATLHRVFEPFFTRRAGGTGLGLSLAQKIVRAHGGTVVARNRPDGGAVIEIALRTERDAAPPPVTSGRRRQA